MTDDERRAVMAIAVKMAQLHPGKEMERWLHGIGASLTGRDKADVARMMSGERRKE